MNKLTIELWNTKKGIYIYKNNKLIGAPSINNEISIKTLIKLLKKQK